MKYRYENFGGVIASEDPPFLAFVDRDYMKSLGLPGSRAWESKDHSIGVLSAPTEVHFAITNKCSVGCPHCYMNGGKTDEGELDTKTMKKALDVLADMQVFHVAMGGGEALEREDLFEVAAYARKIGLVPNLTISGVGLTKEIAKKLDIFGQVNISVDGTGEKYGVYRKINHFDTICKSFELLKDTGGVSSGINCVVGRKNFDEIENIFDLAKKLQLNEIEFLRFKPSGRGKSDYYENRTTNEQNIALAPLLSDLSRKYGVTAKIDCSFIPMLCYHNPSDEVLYSIAAYGCEAGNVLLGIRSNGMISGCSFLEDTSLTVFDLPSAFHAEPNLFSTFRDWSSNAPEPCRSCNYLSICKGGCHAVSKYVYNDYKRPDPECPFVVNFLEKNKL